jgi:hypothetical protein
VFELLEKELYDGDIQEIRTPVPLVATRGIIPEAFFTKPALATDNTSVEELVAQAWSSIEPHVYSNSKWPWIQYCVRFYGTNPGTNPVLTLLDNEGTDLRFPDFKRQLLATVAANSQEPVAKGQKR